MMQKSIYPHQLQDFRNRPLTFEEAKTLLLSDEKKISNVAAVKLQGGFGYFFQGPTLRAKNDFVCDQYQIKFGSFQIHKVSSAPSSMRNILLSHHSKFIKLAQRLAICVACRIQVILNLLS